MLVVLVLMTVMLLGALALARLTEVGSLAAGNSAYREASLQASEIGLNTAFAAVRDVPVLTENVAAGNWYFPQSQAQDGNGLPAVDWDTTPEIVSGAYTIRYVAERMCTVGVVINPLRECLVKQVPVDPKSKRDGVEELDPPNSRQYRVTIRVTGPKDTTTFVQALITKG